MPKLFPLALAAVALAVLPHLAHADVTWTFYETSCAAPCPVPDPRTGQEIAFPYPIATLTLPDATSSGSAVWDGSFFTSPTFSGDPFSFTLTGSFPVTPAFISGPPGHDPGAVTEFALEWDEAPGILAASIFERTLSFAVGIDNLSPLGPAPGNWVAGEPYFGGCLNALCQITGSWQETVPEPSSSALLLTGLLTLVTLALFPQVRRA
jgi:hypothetical protein